MNFLKYSLIAMMFLNFPYAKGEFPPSEKQPYRNLETENKKQTLMNIPRIILTPVRIGTQILFFPIYKLGNAIEEYAVVEHIKDILYNDERTAAILPTATFESDPGSSRGVRIFHEALFKGKALGSYETRHGNGIHFHHAKFEKYSSGKHGFWLEGHFQYDKHPVARFSGVGNDANFIDGEDLGPRDSSFLTRFSQTRYLSIARGGLEFGKKDRPIKAGLNVIHTKRKFRGHFGQQNKAPSIESTYDTSRLPGFRDGTDFFEYSLDMEMDILDSPGQPLGGFSWDLFFGGVPEQDRYSYWHYGTEHQIVFPVFKKNRVILLRTMLEAVDGSDHEIPFTSLPRLGGPHRLRGYELDTFRDKKTALGTIEYHYPIHQYVLGELFAETGTLGRSYSDLFKEWKTGYGFGFLFGSKDDLKVKVDFSFGDGYHFSMSLNPTKAFYQRRRNL